MTRYVLLDTGFQMPYRDNHFVAKDVSRPKSFLDRNIITDVDINNVKVDDQVYTLNDKSDITNFLHTAKFENLKNILELLSEVFEEVSVKEFYTIQLLNRYLTPSNYRILMTFITSPAEFRLFNYATKFTRFNDKPMVASECEQRLRDSKEAILRASNQSNDNMLRLLSLATLGDLVQFTRITLLPPT